MKKILTFSNFIAFLGVLTILFYFIPAVNIAFNDGSGDVNVNLFTATFGGSFVIESVSEIARSLKTCGGLLTAFILGIVAIVLTILKAKHKNATLLACPFYLASGILVACSAPLITTVNLNNAIPAYYNFTIIGGGITVAVFFCLAGLLALIDFIGSIAKPKQQPTY